MKKWLVTFYQRTPFVKKLEFILKFLTVLSALIIFVIDLGIDLPEKYMLSIIVFLLTMIVSGSLFHDFNDIMPTNVELSSRKDLEHAYSLSERFKDAKVVHVAALANKGLWSGVFHSEVIDAMKKQNVNFEFVSIDPEYVETVLEVLNNKILDSKLVNSGVDDILKSYTRFLKENKNLSDQIKYKLCKINLPYALMIIEYKDGSKSVKIDMYDYKVSDGERRSFMLHSKNDPDMVDFYMQQWFKIWEDSTLIE